MTLASDIFAKLASLVGVTPRELERAIIERSMRDWKRILRRELRKMDEVFDEDVDLWDPDSKE